MLSCQLSLSSSKLVNGKLDSQHSKRTPTSFPTGMSMRIQLASTTGNQPRKVWERNKPKPHFGRLSAFMQYSRTPASRSRRRKKLKVKLNKFTYRIFNIQNIVLMLLFFCGNFVSTYTFVWNINMGFTGLLDFSKTLSSCFSIKQMIFPAFGCNIHYDNLPLTCLNSINVFFLFQKVQFNWLDVDVFVFYCKFCHV